MQHIYRVIAHLSAKGVDYTTLEFDVKSETKDNYIVFSDMGLKHTKTRRIPKDEVGKPDFVVIGLEVTARMWVLPEGLAASKQILVEALEKKCDEKVKFAEQMKEGFLVCKGKLGTTYRDLSRRYDG